MIPIEEIRRARGVIAGDAVRTPLLRLHAPEAPAEIYLKLENLQPIGSFKIRGAASAIRQEAAAELSRGVVSASAGNMAQGVAWVAGALGVPCTIVVPETAAQTKLDAIERLGGRCLKVPFARWWQTIEESRFPGLDGVFVHPVENDRVMAGNGTIGLEILEDLPDPDVVLVPWGGGGLSSGIASALRAQGSTAKIFGVEPATAAPLHASFRAGSIQAVDHRPSFVDGAGSRTLLPKMWALGSRLLDGAFTASLDDIAAAVRLLAERSRIVVEGAGACPVAVALSGRTGGRRIVCIVSGGNIDSPVLTKILRGETP